MQTHCDLCNQSYATTQLASYQCVYNAVSVDHLAPHLTQIEMILFYVHDTETQDLTASEAAVL